VDAPVELQVEVESPAGRSYLIPSGFRVANLILNHGRALVSSAGQFVELLEWIALEGPRLSI